MKILKIILGVFCVTGLVMLSGYLQTKFIQSVIKSQESVGSVAIGNDYRNYMASSTSASANTPILLKSRPGTLGSVVVQTTSAGGVFRLYDSATTTLGIATTAPAMIGSFPASAVVGTYTFDITLNNGLVVEAPTGFNGIYTVTYR